MNERLTMALVIGIGVLLLLHIIPFAVEVWQRYRLDVQRAVAQYGVCGRCKTSWSSVAYHATRYAPDKQMLPLCEPCWALLTPAQRLPYYQALLGQWEHAHPGYVTADIRAAVEVAVNEGL